MLLLYVGGLADEIEIPPGVHTFVTRRDAGWTELQFFVRRLIHGDGCRIAPRTEMQPVATVEGMEIEEAMAVLRARDYCPSCCTDKTEWEI